MAVNPADCAHRKNLNRGENLEFTAFHCDSLILEVTSAETCCSLKHGREEEGKVTS